MSLIYTEGYLDSIEVATLQQPLELNIKNILIVPPKNNTKNIILSIFDYSPYQPVYQVHILQNPVFIKGEYLQNNVKYFAQVSRDMVQLYYNKEDE